MWKVHQRKVGRLRGARVVLRPLLFADLDRRLRWVSDPEVQLFMSGRREPRPMQALAGEMRAWMRRRAAEPLSQQWVIEAPEGIPIGDIDIFARDGEGRVAGIIPLIGEPAQRGKGLGGDALRTVVDYAFRELGVERITLDVLADNARAIAAYRRLGFAECGKEQRTGGRWLLMSLDRPPLPPPPPAPPSSL